MALTAGIVGLPNVGKSTLFNAITKSQVEAANYPFATIDKNVKIVEVADKRVDTLAKLVEPEKTIYTTFEFTDIAGLVKGASQGEGLGNQFLSNIREVDAIIQVVRCFQDDRITHVANRINALEDVEIIELELQLADLQVVNNRLVRLEKKAKVDPQAKVEYNLLLQCQKILEAGMPLSQLSDLTEVDEKLFKGFHFLTAKPMIYVANIEEALINNPYENPEFSKLAQLAQQRQLPIIPISALMEEQLSQLDDEERKMFLLELQLDSSGLDKIVKEAYQQLKLKTFFTVGKQEVRAWTFLDGMKASQCAGIIHSDFERGFIKAQIYHYDDMLTYQSEAAIKEAGKMRMEGKDYLMQDGDICHFRFNV